MLKRQKREIGKLDITADMTETVEHDCQHPDCMYRSHNSGDFESCDYLLMTGNERMCPISECDRYKPYAGKRRWKMTGMFRNRHEK